MSFIGAAGPQAFAAEVARGVRKELLPRAAGFVVWLFPAKIAVGRAPTRPSLPPSLQSALWPVVQRAFLAFVQDLRLLTSAGDGGWWVPQSVMTGEGIYLEQMVGSEGCPTLRFTH